MRCHSPSQHPKRLAMRYALKRVDAPPILPPQPTPQQECRRAAEATELDSRRLQLVCGTILINIAAVAALTLYPGSDWRTGMLLNGFDLLLLVGFAVWSRDRYLGHLLGFGLVLGLTELAADAWLVVGTRTLDYSVGGGPMLWRSPVWMPLAWQVVAVQFAVVGERLRRWHAVWGLVTTALLGALNIPYYEEMARRIHWWTYSNCRMISGTPYYIILGELFIAAAIALFADSVRRQTVRTTVVSGIGGGGAIFLAYAGAFAITDL